MRILWKNKRHKNKRYALRTAVDTRAIFVYYSARNSCWYSKPSCPH